MKNISTLQVKNLIGFLLIFLVLSSGYVLAHSSWNLNENNKNHFIKKHNEHMALVQFYRWFQIFEREQTAARINNHLSMLSDSVLVTTQSGLLEGKAGMLGFMNYVSSWKNTHHIEKISVVDNKDGNLFLEADIVYQNILPDGGRNSYRLHYTTQLEKRKGDLPIFTSLTLLPTAVIKDRVFEDAYVENRSTSLVYYWMYLADNRNMEKMHDLLTSDVQVRSGKDEISGNQRYTAWLNRSQNKYEAELRTFKNITSSMDADGSIHLSMDVEWKGVDGRGRNYSSESHHQWLVSDNADETFARIKKMTITETVPIRKIG